MESGQPLWEWDARSDVEAMTLTEAGDVLVALLAHDGSVDVRRLDGRTGSEVETWTVASSPAPVGPGLVVHTATLGALGNDPVLATNHALVDRGGALVDGVSHVRRLGEQEWAIDAPGAVRLAMDVHSTHLAILGDELFSLEPTGDQRWLEHTDSTAIQVLALADGGAVSLSPFAITGFGPDGDLGWRIDTTSINIIDLSALNTSRPTRAEHSSFSPTTISSRWRRSRARSGHG